MNRKFTYKCAVINNGSAIHIGIVQPDGKMTETMCGAEFSKNQNQRRAEVREANENYQIVTCKRCLKTQNKK